MNAGNKQLRKRIIKIIPVLDPLYPDTKPLLHYSDCFQLLIATILSAQCTDAQVNKITPDLFSCYSTPADLAGAELQVIERLVYSTGFYKNKARNVKDTARKIEKTYKGKVPSSMEALLSLPGIGRKSANVIRAHCFKLPAIIVDTHFSRVVKRLGLTADNQAEKIEKEIMGLLNTVYWNEFSMRINLHGRYICKARNPLCDQCTISRWCDYFIIHR